ncbi:FecCD family ABC transporter permease [Photobacterium lipolyticum]|uniref:Iron ABC transporter permease n=1 Tax=Photobacterium lipolyticum TaxID=266810 RepID=A0A2T3N2W2_9GAMM|nr:iron ABC transporter permease [Photobacterium lipolyticum]PSW06594.1 iron ABC transporter permease [Photobacterium lipolyticum]
MKPVLSVIFVVSALVFMLIGPNWINPQNMSAMELSILTELRVPRVLFSAIIGAMLGLSGSIYQLTLKNPLADSFTTGAASSSALGAVLAIAIGVPVHFISVFAFVTGMAGLMMVYRLSLTNGRINPITMILAGVVMNVVASAVISFSKYYFEDSLNSIVYWLMGGIFMVSWDRLAISVVIFALTFIFLHRQSMKLNILALDEHSAQSLGVNVHLLRSVVFVLSTLLVSVAVSFSGIIGFVGLIVPHVSRSLFGSDMKQNIFYSSLFGSFLLMASDTLSRVIIPGGAELPVGIITAVSGGLFFFYLLQTRRERFWNG